MLFVQPEAEADSVEARTWSESQRISLDDELIAEMKRTFGLIEGSSQSYAIVYRQTRKARLRKFPYLVFFTERGVDVVILGNFHDRRDPRVMQSRIV